MNSKNHCCSEDADGAWANCHNDCLYLKSHWGPHWVSISLRSTEIEAMCGDHCFWSASPLPFRAQALLSNPPLADFSKGQLQPQVLGEAFSDGSSLGLVPCKALCCTAVACLVGWDSYWTTWGKRHILFVLYPLSPDGFWAQSRHSMCTSIRKEI